MNTFDKNMTNVFGVTPISNDSENGNIDTNKKTNLPTHYNGSNLQQDLTDAYQQSRENLQNIIDQGQEAMEDILQIAKAGQHPRAFEVYGTLLKNMVDANKELLNIQKQIRDIGENKKTKGDTNIDKAIFVGSTTELQKFLKNGNK